MKSIQKQVIYYSITFLISFSLGLLFDHYVLCKSFVQREIVKKGRDSITERRIPRGRTN